MADLVTAANGVCGFLAIAVAGHLVLSPSAGPQLDHRTLVRCLLLYGIGMACDVLDGPIARRTGSSGLGSTLDTICDTISFGMLPATLLVARAHGSSGLAAVVVAAVLYIAATMIRLSRQAALEAEAKRRAARIGGEAQRTRFTGMPSPVGGNCILAIVVFNPPAGIAAAAAAAIAYMLVARFEYPNNSSIGGVFVAGLLVTSFVAIAGVISLKVPSAIALVGLIPAALLGLARQVRDA